MNGEPEQPLLSSNLRINAERLWQSLDDMAQIGPGVSGGCNRQTLTPEDAEGRALFQRWCESAGCSMALDQMGTMYAVRAGLEPDALPVCIGSHLDTQPTGGRYDGVLGVLAGLEIVRTLNDLNIQTRRPLLIVNWTNEEGARFAPAMMASGVYAGIHSLDWAYQQTDQEGIRFADALKAIGYVGEEPVGKRQMHAYFELHIEQGPILEQESKDIGVVTHGQGLKWLQVELTGKGSHTGSTPMALRRNAGLGMARITQVVDDIAWRYAPHAVGAVGHCVLYPNSRNVIPQRAEFTVDFRHPEKAVLEEMEQALSAAVSDIATELGLQSSIHQSGGFDPVTFDETCVDRVRNAAKLLGYSYRDIISGAGHDACWLTHTTPSAMVMCPCEDGLSHNEAESILPEWAEAGANVLFHAALQTAGIAKTASE